MSTVDDPHLKKNMKEQVLHIMYTPYLEQRKRRLMSLVARNQVLQGTGYEMFSFRGITYGLIPVGTHVKPKLHPELHHAMQEWIAEAHHVRDHERPYVDSYIALVLNSSDSARDWLRLLPEVFHTPILAYLNQAPPGPCELSDEQIATIKTKNLPSIDLMRQRMARNLLLT